jgi:hypothetical protein
MKYNKLVLFTEELVFKNNYGLYLILDSPYTRKLIEEEMVEKASYLATVSVKLIWNFSKKKYGFCNFLTDGFCIFVGSKEELLNTLNNSEDKYRILTKEELYFIIDNKSNSSQLFNK